MVGGPWGTGLSKELLLPPRLVPPPAVSCREGSPGLEWRWTWQWTAALGKQRGMTGVPSLGSEEDRGPHEPGQGKSPGLPDNVQDRAPPLRWPAVTHVLKRGSPEQEHSNGDLCKSR